MNININVAPDPRTLGQRAADAIASLVLSAIEKQGEARIILSTGASQFFTLEALVQKEIPWEAVTMFHLDEYVGLPESHPASFRKYLKERFIEKVHPGACHLVNGEGDVAAHIAFLTEKIREKPVDVGVIGIGENGHIAFNDPPADFDAEESYFVVGLDDKCKKQQVGEGWFASLQEVPSQAISMTPRQIMAARHIVTAVPFSVKAEAILHCLKSPISPHFPASLLKSHPDWQLFLDVGSASRLFPLK